MTIVMIFMMKIMTIMRMIMMKMIMLMEIIIVMMMTKYVTENLKVVTSDFLTARSVSPSRTLPECQICRFATIASRYAASLLERHFFNFHWVTTPSMQLTQEMQHLSCDIFRRQKQHLHDDQVLAMMMIITITMMMMVIKSHLRVRRGWESMWGRPAQILGLPGKYLQTHHHHFSNYHISNRHIST